MTSDMKIKILSYEESKEIRNIFEKNFLLSWKEYKTENNEWIKLITSKNYSISAKMIHYYERISISKETSFESALNRLSNKNGDVYFMSESEEFPDCKGIIVDGNEYKGHVGVWNASKLSELINSEWEKYMDDENSALILPLNLYVFDSSFKKVVVFSEEIECFVEETENGGEEIETRLCFGGKARRIKDKVN